MSDLKPCPVCERRVDLLPDGGLLSPPRIRCDECGYIFMAAHSDIGVEEMRAKWNALPRPCRHEWEHVDNGPNMPSTGRCRKCGQPMGVETGQSQDPASGGRE